MHIEDGTGSSRSYDTPIGEEEAVSNYNDVLVIVPAFEEATIISEVISNLRKTFSQVLVVDDGSSDDTSANAAAAGAHVARHLVNIGQGGALQTGFRVAGQLAHISWVVTFDADGQHRVEDATRMVDTGREENLDIVLGTRFDGGSSNASRSKRLILRLATFYTRITSGLAVTDTHNGLRAMTVDLARRVEIQDRGMGHASDILDYIASHNATWAEVPVRIEYTDYSKAKGQSMTNAVNIVFDRWLR